MNQLLLLLCLFPLSLSQPFYYYAEEKVITNIAMQPIESCEAIAECEYCISKDCLWCPSLRTPCIDPRQTFYCPEKVVSPLSLYSDVAYCRSLKQTSVCSGLNSCSSCLQAGCQWCDGDGGAILPSCTTPGTPIDCTIAALHGPGGTCGNCSGASSCTSCLAVYGCAWCDGDGSGMYPPMCLNPNLPFGCSISAFHSLGGLPC